MTWLNLGNFTGPQGEQGDPGPSGEKGDPGMEPAEVQALRIVTRLSR